MTLRERMRNLGTMTEAKAIEAAAALNAVNKTPEACMFETARRFGDRWIIVKVIFDACNAQCMFAHPESECTCACGGVNHARS